MEITTTAITSITTVSAKSGGVITTIAGDYSPIVDKLLHNKWQLYNKTRQKLTADVKMVAPIQPLSLFEDSKQIEIIGGGVGGADVLKKFVLTAYRFKPISGICTVELQEYDNTTEVTLV